jgi:hypothetical protein
MIAALLRAISAHAVWIEHSDCPDSDGDRREVERWRESTLAMVDRARDAGWLSRAELQPIYALILAGWCGCESSQYRQVEAILRAAAGGAGRGAPQTGDSADGASIPAEHRTAAVPRKVAAKAYRPDLSEKRAREALNTAMASGELRFIEQSPQRIIFDRRQIDPK